MACNSGYTLIGSSVATCDNGSWNFSSSNGRCRKNGSVTFNYTGGVQTFNPSNYGLISGDVITFEVYGAQGGGDQGGLGGYTNGNYTITNNQQVLYIVTGGQNYNGGGNITGGGCGNGHGFGAVGGGATHISTTNGTLDNSSVRNNAIIVAGGGGGRGESLRSGGAGGGGNNNGGGGVGNTTENGEAGGGRGGKTYEAGVCSDNNYCRSGSGSVGGDAVTAAGAGDNGIWCGGGGGGGWYGGSSGEWGKYNHGGGGGGSGFCGNGAYNCGGSNGTNKGNGYAKISW